MAERATEIVFQATAAFRREDGDASSIRETHCQTYHVNHLPAFAVGGCGVINVGKWKGIETTSSDENTYLLKDAFLTAGSAALPEETTSITP